MHGFFDWEDNPPHSAIGLVRCPNCVQWISPAMIGEHDCNPEQLINHHLSLWRQQWKPYYGGRNAAPLDDGATRWSEPLFDWLPLERWLSTSYGRFARYEAEHDARHPS
jgi:hypothetical protein